MRWIAVLSYFCKKESEKAGVTGKGFDISGVAVRPDGTIAYSVPDYVPGDPEIFDIVDRLFGYVDDQDKRNESRTVQEES